jgi:hypothetical protein
LGILLDQYKLSFDSKVIEFLDSSSNYSTASTSQTDGLTNGKVGSGTNMEQNMSSTFDIIDISSSGKRNSMSSALSNTNLKEIKQSKSEN